MVTEVEDFEGGAPGAVVSSPYLSYIAGDPTYTGSPAVGSLAAAPGPEFSGQLTRTITGPSGYSNLNELWAGEYQESFPDYGEFRDLIIAIYGSEEAGFEALDSSFGSTVPILAWSQRTFLRTEGGSDYMFDQVAETFTDGGWEFGVTIMADGTDTSVLQISTWNGESRFIDPVVGRVPHDQWLTISWTQSGGTVSLRVEDASGGSIRTQAWTLPAGDFISQTNSFVVGGDGSHTVAYLDDVTWVYGDEVVVERQPTRMYPRHDGRGLSSAPRMVGGYT